MRRFGRFWWDFIVGDDWRIAAGVVLSLGLGALLVSTTNLSHGLIAVLTAVATALVAVASIVAAARR